MTIAYFDTIGGISGDMTLGAFVHAGVPLDFLRQELLKLPAKGYSLAQSTVQRNAITAVKLSVMVEGEHGDARPHSHGDHHHTHDEHSHQHQDHSSPTHQSRSLADILALIQNSALAPRIKDRASKIFTVIGTAEAKIHNIAPEQIHFHEVGAVDSIVDIVGTAICLEYFGIDAVYSSPVKLGCGGFVNTQHGKMPNPTPATVEILKEVPDDPDGCSVRTDDANWRRDH